MPSGGFKYGDDLIVRDAGKLLEEVRDVMAFLQPVKKRLNSNTSACKTGFTVHHVRPDEDDVFHGMILPRANRMTICAGEAADRQPFQGEPRGESPPARCPKPTRGNAGASIAAFVLLIASRRRSFACIIPACNFQPWRSRFGSSG